MSGRLDRGVHELLGVPYAAAPSGALRFAAPERAPQWDGTRPATSPGPTAPQPELPGFAPAVVVPGDDYLHLNVWTPSLGADRLPVLVWIHGGGWVVGSNADPTINGRCLASRGLVVASVNYRIGVDGFMALSDAPANRGVLDWILALQWVQENIEQFGGDPDQVTVAGHSAGSAAALILTTMPRADGLFRRVLAMSGVPWNLPRLDEVTPKAESFAATLGVERTIAGIGSVGRAPLLSAQNEAAPLGGVAPSADALDQFHRVVTVPSWLGPVVDGDVIPEAPLPALVAGSGVDRDLMIGSTRQELDVLISAMGAGIHRTQAEVALERVGISPEAARRWCDEGYGKTPAEALGSALTQISFRAPVLQVAESRRSAPGETYLYETTWSPPTLFGALHGLDVPYAFDNIDSPGVDLMAGGEPPQSLADDFAEAVSGFVRDGKPGWSPYANDRSSWCFDCPSDGRADADSLVRAVFLPRRPPTA